MKKVIAAIAVGVLSLTSLSACSLFEGASKEEVREGLKETIAYLDYHALHPTNWKERINSDRVVQIADCIVDKAYDDLSGSARDTIAKGKHEKITLDDDDYEIMNRASRECGWN